MSATVVFRGFLAMQKVVGSSPIIRSFQIPQHLLLLAARVTSASLRRWSFSLSATLGTTHAGSREPPSWAVTPNMATH
jgi:hypothetical protein